MQPKLVRKDIKYQKKTLIIVSVLVISLFIGGSFALLSSSAETKDVVTFKTGNFNLEVATEGTLSLEGEVPKSYDDGFKSNDITLTLTNTGSLEIGKYEVKLEGDSTTTLEANYIRYSVSEDEGKTYLASKLLSDTNNIIYTGYNLKDKKILKVKIWIDEEAGEDALKKSYNGKIKVELYQNEDTAVQVVKSKLVSNYSGSNESFEGGVVAVNNDGNLYHETNSEEIREYRYSGPTVNNYVTFNDETWRIIGVFKDESGSEHLKIVRNGVITNQIIPDNFVKNNNNYQLQFHFSTGEDRVVDDAYWNRIQGKSTISNWTTAGLMYFLNFEKDESEDSNLGYLHYLNDESKKMIAETTYYLGNVTISTESNNNIGDTAYKAYINERKKDECPVDVTENSDINNCNIWYGNKPTWKGKIALMYASDVGYSSNSKFWKSIDMFDSEYTTKIDNSNWMFLTLNRYNWLLNPSSSSNKITLFVALQTTSINKTSKTTIDYGSLVRPSLYLKTNVKITSGTGEQTNPYTLSLD